MHDIENERNLQNAIEFGHRMAEKGFFLEIVPCPFCGKAAQINLTIGKWWRVQCWNSKCLIAPYLDGLNKEEIIKIWNKRIN